MRIFIGFKSRKLDWIRSVIAFIAFSAFASSLSILGPTIIDLQIRTGETYERISNLIPARASGYIIGTLIGGYLIDNFNKQLVICVTLFTIGVYNIIVPWFRNLLIMAITFSIGGLLLGAVDVCLNVLIIFIWGVNSPPVLQILHMSYGIGSMVIPMICDPFILPVQRDDELQRSIRESFEEMDTPMNTSSAFTQAAQSYVQLFMSPVIASKTGAEFFSTELETNSTSVIQRPYTPDDVMVQYPYMYVGTLSLLMSIFFMVLYTFAPLTDDKKENKKIKNQSQKVETETQQLTPAEIKRKIIGRYLAIITFIIFANFLFGLQYLIGTVGYSFGVKSDMKLPKTRAVLLSSVYWMTFTFTRVIFLVATYWIKAETVIKFNFFLIFLSSVFIAPWGNTNETCLWLGLVFTGLGVSPMFSHAFGSLQKYFPVTGLLTSIIIFTGAIGEFIYPVVVAKSLDTNPVIFCYGVAMCNIACIICYIVLGFVGKIYFPEAAKIDNEICAKRVGKTSDSAIAS